MVWCNQVFLQECNLLLHIILKMEGILPFGEFYWSGNPFDFAVFLSIDIALTIFGIVFAEQWITRDQCGKLEFCFAPDIRFEHLPLDFLCVFTSYLVSLCVLIFGSGAVKAWHFLFFLVVTCSECPKVVCFGIKTASVPKFSDFAEIIFSENLNNILSVLTSLLGPSHSCYSETAVTSFRFHTRISFQENRW